MAISLLKTKLYIPPLRPGGRVLSRRHLIERLKKGLALGCKLILLSAPAGFGKTTLVSEWIHQLDLPGGWVSLDRRDNDPVRFLTYLVAALQTIDARLGGELQTVMQSPQPPAAEMVLTSLINDLAEYGAPVVLVLDDCHEITAQAVHDMLTFMLDHLPPQMHLVVATRVDPPWPLARLRARQEMIELRSLDLRFTRDESAAFFNQVMGLELSAESIAVLDARTEGWIAGLQMAALSVQGREVAHAAGFVQAFSGTHRFILDYLVEEVLDVQSPAIQTFLLRTSILDRLSAPLCDAVMGWSSPAADSAQENSHTILARLERTNLFLVPLDDERRWYRYHHLFADLLRTHLQETYPAEVTALYRRASAWCQEAALIEEAVHYALAAGDVERVAHLVEGSAFALLEYGELGTLLGWLGALPRQAVAARPWLCIAYAWALVYAGQTEQAGPLLDGARAGLQGLAPADARDVSGHIAAIRSYGTWQDGDHGGAAEHARQALEVLSDKHVVARCFAALALGSSLVESGNLSAAERALTEALEAGQRAGNTHIPRLAASYLAYLLVQQGRLRRAAALCRTTLGLDEDRAAQLGSLLPGAGNLCGVLSEVLCEWDEPDAAVQLAREGVALSKRWGQADAMVFCLKQLAMVLSEAGDVSGAFETIEQARQVASHISHWFATIVTLTEAEVNLSCGNVGAIARWAEGRQLGPDDQNLLTYRQTYTLFSRLLLAQGRLDEAARLLVRLVRECEQGGATRDLIKALVQYAVVLQAQGKTGEALASLRRALALAAPEGYVRTFVRHGTRMGDLLSQILAQQQPGQPSTSGDGTADYAGRLLALLEGRPEGTGAQVRDQAGTQTRLPLVEPLTEREIEVLRLLRTALSQSEMADHLYVSVNTIRSHIKNVYAKLGVHSRTEALDRAQELDLL